MRCGHWSGRRRGRWDHALYPPPWLYHPYCFWIHHEAIVLRIRRWDRCSRLSRKLQIHVVCCVILNLARVGTENVDRKLLRQRRRRAMLHITERAGMGIESSVCFGAPAPCARSSNGSIASIYPSKQQQQHRSYGTLRRRPLDGDIAAPRRRPACILRLVTVPPCRSPPESRLGPRA